MDVEPWWLPYAMAAMGLAALVGIVIGKIRLRRLDPARSTPPAQGDE